VTTPTETVAATDVYRNCIYIKATPEAIWDAITQSEWTERYGSTAPVEYDLRPGGTYKVFAPERFKAESARQGREVPDVVIEGEVLEVDPPRRLVVTFRMLVEPALAKEPTALVTYEIEQGGHGTTSLTLTLDPAPGAINRPDSGFGPILSSAESSAEGQAAQQGGTERLVAIASGAAHAAQLSAADPTFRTATVGGYNWVLSDLKTLLETGSAFKD
jgi:uncharacterized protein YndB with AHSA1/START domain